jgi:poly-gamma-glutamate capsule biosynthesis protein CapA/YwtB (metallophosphatase superfamily)
VKLLAFHTSGATNDVNDLSAARALVKWARAEADVVVVSFHGGGEGPGATRVVKGVERYLGENRGDVTAFAHGVVEAGADLVIGHGPHVLRGLELHRGRLIAYSLGNFATYGRFALGSPLNVGAVLEVELAKDGTFVRGRLLPTVQEGKGVPRRDPEARAVTLAAALTAADFPETGVKIAPDGALTPR